MTEVLCLNFPKELNGIEDFSCLCFHGHED